ncbi:MAG: AAA family ATPase [Candidatus Hydrothermarchaeota archaeon]
MKVLGITGMPGSGKTQALKVFYKKGFSIVSMGDVIRDLAREKGIKEDPESIGRIAIEIRKNEGEDAVAKRCVKKILGLKKNVVIEGIRSLHEIDCFKKYFDDFVIVSIHASPKTRYERLKRRGRPDDPKNFKEFLERDKRELNIGMGSVIAKADFMVVNESSLEKLYEEIEKIARIYESES